jgi:hypothetical protein
MRVFVEVNGCKDCPYRGTLNDMGARWEACLHPDFKHMNSVEDYVKEGFAPWCPLLKNTD